jgi:hypothetical protein
MMQYWINKESESDNVVAISDVAIFIGSCEKESYASAEKLLSEGKSLIEVLGTDDLMTIPYSKIQKIVSRSTDDDVDISYKAKKDTEEESVAFNNTDIKQAFMTSIEAFMPKQLVKTQSQQSAIGAAISPLISLGLASLTTHLFIDKLRWAALVIGGIWAIGSLIMLTTRAKNPPTITRWSIDGKLGRKLWSGLKTLWSYIIIAVVVAVVAQKFPISYGEKNLYDHMIHGNLKTSNVAELIEQGGDVNYKDSDGDTTLSLTLNYGEDTLSMALIEAGTNLATPDNVSSPLEQAIYNDVGADVVELMLSKGASLSFDMGDMTPAEYTKEYSDVALHNVIIKHTTKQ